MTFFLVSLYGTFCNAKVFNSEYWGIQFIDYFLLWYPVFGIIIKTLPTLWL